MLSLVLLALAPLGVGGVAAADAPPRPGGGRAAVCPQIRGEEPKLYGAVVRTPEYKDLARSLAPGFRLVMNSTQRAELVDGRCLVVVGVYVDHPGRLESRALFGVEPRSYSVFVQDPVSGDFRPARSHEESVPAAPVPAQASPAPARDWRSVDPARQGYPRERSAAMLDPQVRRFLDGVLRLYKEEGLLTDRAKALQALGVTHTTRRWSTEPALPGRHSHYFDTFASEGVFARPGWSGEYAYHSHGADPQTWHALIRISFDRAQGCQNSRAVEGYLDLQLDPGIRQQVHPVPERLFRHEVDFAQPYAPPLSTLTPQLSMIMRGGCVVAFHLARIFRFKEVSDAHARG